MANGSWKGKSLLPLLIISEKVDTYVIIVYFPDASQVVDASSYTTYPRFRTLLSMIAKEYRMEEHISLSCKLYFIYTLLSS
jgi:hypothetical protein